MLTSAEVAFFRTNGYLLPRRQLFAAEQLAELESIFSEEEDLAGNTYANGPAPA